MTTISLPLITNNYDCQSELAHIRGTITIIVLIEPALYSTLGLSIATHYKHYIIRAYAIITIIGTL